MPAFSIVITTTRPRWVVFALESALAQDCSDLEIIVSDNSDEGCQALVEGFDDARVKYVRPKEYMTLIEHWNFAFSHATGDWQMLLCDDHACLPRLLPTVADAIEKNPDVDTVFWKIASFYDDEWFFEKDRNQLICPDFSNSTSTFSASQVVEEMFDSGSGIGAGFGSNHVKLKVPLIPRSFYSKRVIERIKKGFDGRFFVPIDPMTAAALAGLTFSEKTLRINLPLTVVGMPNDSAAGHLSGNETFERMHRGTEIKHIPLKSMAVFPVPSAETTLHVQQLLSKELGHLQLNWVNFFIGCHNAITDLQSQGANTEPLWTKYQDALNTFSDDVKTSVSNGLIPEPYPSLLTRGVRKVRRVIGQGVRTVHKGEISPVTIWNTKQHQLDDVLKSAQFLDKKVADYVH